MGHVEVGWGGSCKGGVGWVGDVGMRVGHAGLDWVM